MSSPFSIMRNDSVPACLSLMAMHKPEKPAPTIKTSTATSGERWFVAACSVMLAPSCCGPFVDCKPNFLGVRSPQPRPCQPASPSLREAGPISEDGGTGHPKEEDASYGCRLQSHRSKPLRGSLE